MLTPLVALLLCSFALADGQTPSSTSSPADNLTVVPPPPVVPAAPAGTAPAQDPAALAAPPPPPAVEQPPQAPAAASAPAQAPQVVPPPPVVPKATKRAPRKKTKPEEALDFSRCNGLAGHAGVSLKGEGKPFFRVGNALEFDSANPRTLLISKSAHSVEYYEYVSKADSALRVGEGFGSEGVIRSTVKLEREDGKPSTLRSHDLWFPLDQLPEAKRGWVKIKGALRNKTLKLTKTERTHETESWIHYGFSQGRCYVSQEGESVRGRKLVTFDQALCNQVLRITEANPSEVLAAFRSSEKATKSNANRELRLIRDAQIHRDEQLRGQGIRLLAVLETPPEHQLPGTMPREDSAALHELRACIAAQVRNGLRRPEALGKENTDFMGAEPSNPEVVVEPSATGLPAPAPEQE